MVSMYSKDAASQSDKRSVAELWHSVHSDNRAMYSKTARSKYKVNIKKTSSFCSLIE